MVNRLLDTQQRQIRALADEKGICLLAHYYQTPDIQDIADAVGDSFELARFARDDKRDTLCLCGVRFMAESAKILSPHKTVLLPALDAGCPMADMATDADIRRMRKAYPEAAVMCYVNSTAEVKALSDICCTSSSAVRIARSLPQREIIFVPDRNLGSYVASQVPEKIFHLHDGYCPVHHRVTVKDVQAAKAAHPAALVLVHPECRPEVVAMADGVGSTSWILSEVENAPADQSFLIGTEQGVLERLQRRSPNRSMWLLRAGFVCPNMKKTTLADVQNALEAMSPRIELEPKLMDAARSSLTRMVESL